MNKLHSEKNKFIFYRPGEVESDATNYLFVEESSPKLQYLYAVGEQYQRQKLANYNKNYLLAEEYELIIDEIAQFIKNIGICDNTTSYYTIYSYLLWNGYISQNNRFLYDTENITDMAGFAGFNVVLGKGCCRNIADLFNKVLCRLEIDSHFLINSSLIKSRNYEPNFYDAPNHTETINYMSCNQLDDIGDHASVLVKEKGNFYIYDPTNLIVFKLDDSLIGNLYNGEGECHIKPWGFIMFENLKQEDILKMIVDIEQQSNNTFMKNNEVKDITDETINVCKKNKSLVLDLHNQVLKHLDTIKKQRR